MGALPTPQPAYPHAPYIEELHDFFTVHHVPFGSPSDLAPLVERIDDPGLFHEDFRAVVRFILAREEGISRSDLLAILAVAVGGPLIYRSAPQLRQPLNRLLKFVDGVLRRPDGHPVPVSRAEVIPFPANESVTEVSSVSVPRSRSRVWFTAMPRPAVRSLGSAGPSPSFRNTLYVAAGAAILVVLMALFLRPGATHAAAVNVPGGFYVAKPSAFGEAFEPALRPFLRYEEAAPARFATRADTVAANFDSSQLGDADSLSAAALESAPEHDAISPAVEPEPQPTPNSSPTAQPSPLSLELAPEFSTAQSVSAEPAGVVESSAPVLVAAPAAPSAELSH